MRILAVIWDPVGVLGQVASERRVLAGFVVTAVYAAVGLLGALVTVLGGSVRAQFALPETGLPPGLPVEDFVLAAEVATLVSAVLTPFVIWLAATLLMQLTTRLFGGEGPISAMFAAVGVAAVPLVLSSAVALALAPIQLALGPQSAAGVSVGYLSGLIGLAAALWYIALVIIGAARARGIGYGESTGSCAVSCVGCLGLIILVAVIVGLGTVLIVGPAVAPSG